MRNHQLWPSLWSKDGKIVARKQRLNDASLNEKPQASYCPHNRIKIENRGWNNIGLNEKPQASYCLHHSDRWKIEAEMMLV